MRTPVIISAVRTPSGKFLGSLKTLQAPQLGAIAVREAVARAGVDAVTVEECIMGNVLSAGVGQAPARQAALIGGLSNEVAALTINKVCGSGLKAVMLAAQGIITNEDNAAIQAGLDEIAGEIVAGTFPFSAELEDIHLNIEARLTERIGEAGKRLHTGRSRNDQVATDF